MKTIHVASAFFLNLGNSVIKIAAGVQTVEDEVADHWFTKAHLKDGGMGAEAYAKGARATADNAYVKAKEAIALFNAAEKTSNEAEAAAGMEISPSAHVRLGGDRDADGPGDVDPVDEADPAPENAEDAGDHSTAEDVQGAAPEAEHDAPVEGDPSVEGAPSTDEHAGTADAPVV